MIDQKRRQEIIEKIQACFRRDESRGASQAEAETSIKMAKRLMASYNISQAECSEACESDSIVEEGGLEHRKELAKFEIQIALVCQYLFNVKMILLRRYVDGLKREFIIFIGYEVDVALAKAAFKIIRDEVNEIASKCQFKDYERDKFKFGVACVLVEKARSMVEGLTKEQENMCRAVVVSKEANIQKYVDGKHGKLKEWKTNVDMSKSFMDGIIAGRKMNLDFTKKLEAA